MDKVSDILLFLEAHPESYLKVAKILACSYFSYKFYKIVQHVYRFNRVVREIPVNPAFPLKFGCFQKTYHLDRHEVNDLAYKAGRDIPEQVRGRCPKGLSKVYFLPFYPIVFLSDKACMSSLWRSSKHIEKIEIQRKIFKTLILDQPDNLLISQGQRWKEKRKYLAKTMHRDLHLDYSMNINKHVSHHCREIARDMKDMTGNDTDDGLIFYDYESQINLSILTENMFGCEFTDQEERSSFIKSWEDIADLIEQWVCNPILIERLPWKLYQFFTGVDDEAKIKTYHRNMTTLIEKRIQVLEAKNVNVNESDKGATLFIDILLKLYQEGVFTFNDIRNEAFVFFAAGLDTTTHAMSGGVYGLSHPSSQSIQEKLQMEIDRFFPQLADLEEKDFDPEILGNMPYLDAVVKETFRVFGPTPMLGREVSGTINLTENFALENEHGVPVPIFVGSKWASDFQIGSDFENFRPERFLDKEYDHKDATFAPFSRGVRDCIGQAMAVMNMKIQLIQIYKRFDTKIVVKTEDDKKLNRPRVSNFVVGFKDQPRIRFLERQ